METMDKKLLEPQTNVLQISNKSELRQSIFRLKVYLKKFEEVELHALGEAINSAVNVAENMQRNGFSNIVSVVQSNVVFSIDSNNTQQQQNDEDKSRKKLKLTIKVRRTNDCLQKLKDIK